MRMHKSRMLPPVTEDEARQLQEHIDEAARRFKELQAKYPELFPEPNGPFLRDCDESILEEDEAEWAALRLKKERRQKAWWYRLWMRITAIARRHQSGPNPAS